MSNDIARRWHDGSDHARDGEPFGGPLCNCLQVAERIAHLIHEWGVQAGPDGGRGVVLTC